MDKERCEGAHEQGQREVPRHYEDENQSCQGRPHDIGDQEIPQGNKEDPKIRRKEKEA